MARGRQQSPVGSAPFELPPQIRADSRIYDADFDSDNWIIAHTNPHRYTDISNSWPNRSALIFPGGPYEVQASSSPSAKHVKNTLVPYIFIAQKITSA